MHVISYIAVTNIQSDSPIAYPYFILNDTFIQSSVFGTFIPFSYNYPVEMISNESHRYLNFLSTLN